MALSKDISRYSGKFFDLAQQLEQTGQVILKCPDKKTAMNLRFQFYGFRRAALAAGLGQQFPNLAGCAVKITDSVVSFLAADSTEIASVLAQIPSGETQARTQEPDTPPEPFPTVESLVQDFLTDLQKEQQS
jgi:hypothetical protein